MTQTQNNKERRKSSKLAVFFCIYYLLLIFKGINLIDQYMNKHYPDIPSDHAFSAVFFTLFYGPFCFLIIRALIKSHKRRQRDKAASALRVAEFNAQCRNNSFKPAKISLTPLYLHDPNFAERPLLEFAYHLIDQIWHALSITSTQPLKLLCTDNILELFNYQVDELKAYKLCEKHEYSTPLASISIADYRADSQDEYLDVHLSCYINHSFNHKRSQRPIKGRSTSKQTLLYKLTFIRKLGNTTSSLPPAYTTVCPNCGDTANLSLSHFCPSCYSYISMGTNDWLLDNYEVHRQLTNTTKVRFFSN